MYKAYVNNELNFYEVNHSQNHNIKKYTMAHILESSPTGLSTHELTPKE